MGERQLDKKTQLIKVVRFTMTAILVLAGLVIMVPLAFSYLSATQEQGIAIRAASAAEIWEMQGSFDVDRWKIDNHTGINIHNKSPRDLWIFFEFTGDLKQVFKQSGPLLVKAGETCPVILGSLDKDDSPRVPNPLELIEFQSGTRGKTTNGGCLPPLNGQWQWKTFVGQVKIHTLNSYAILEVPTQVSGSVLWDIYFSNICGMTACELSRSHTSVDEVRLMTADVEMNRRMESEALDEGSEDGVLQSARDYLTRLKSFQTLQFIAPIQAAVERMAPGLWQEHEELKARLCEGADTIQRLINMVEILTEEKQQLECRLEDQQYTIKELRNQLDEARVVTAPETDIVPKEEALQSSGSNDGQPEDNSGDPSDGDLTSEPIPDTPTSTADSAASGGAVPIQDGSPQ